MPTITLNIPTLVQNVKIEGIDHYHVRPFFFSHPIATHRRFANAEAQFKKELKNSLKSFVLNFEHHQTLGWYLFNPSIKYLTLSLNLHVNKQFVSGKFGVGIFKIQQLTFLSLPTFRNYLCIIDNGKGTPVDVKEAAERIIADLLVEFKQVRGSAFDIAEFYATGKEFVKIVQQKVQIKNAPFSFEETDLDGFYAKMSGQVSFNGGIETERVGTNLNVRFPAELGRAFFQEALVQQVFQIIYQKENTPLVLIGAVGIGKHSIIEEVVYRYLSNYYQENKGRQQNVWHLNPNRIIAGMSVVGMWEKRFEAILKFIQAPEPKATSPDKILIDNPVALLRIGKSASNSLTLSHVLKPYLEKRQLHVTLLATPEEWKVVQEQDRGFADLFQVIRMQEPDLETSVKIVLEKRRYLELEHDCLINIQAINQLFTIQRNYLKNKALPGSVLKLLTQLATKYKFSSIDAPEVRHEFKAFSGLKEQIFDEHTRLEADEVYNTIAQDLVGQPEAVAALSEVVHLIKAKLTDKSKPLGSFLFIGPTGVGKTQGAKVLCQYLMGNQDNLLRFDMNEYIDEYSVERLIGNYANPEGLLTGKVRYRPFGVILFDEIEKGHPKVHDLLLQVLDDGRLTDSLGRTVDFSNTIIIMTSNVGAQEIGMKLGFGSSSQDDSAIYQKALRNKFRPEFINRIDKIVVFHALSFAHIQNIARLQIKELLKRDGFVRRTTILNISQEALEWVAQRGYDAKMGGRALKRQIERDLTMLSAEQLIATHTESPIIFDIELVDNVLIPKITPLDFVQPLKEDWLPNFPDETKGRRFYDKLVYEVEAIERAVSRFDSYRSTDVIVTHEDDTETLDWQYYDFKNRLAEIKEQIKTIRLGFSERYFREAPAIPLRLKSSTFYPKKDTGAKVYREHFKDQLFQKEALKEVSEAYQYAPQQFDSLKTEYIDNFLNVAFLKIISKGFLSGQLDKITLQFDSAIVGMGKEEIDFLIQLYLGLFQNLDIAYQYQKGNHFIQAEGHSLYELLKGEVGIHLFYKVHQNPLPINIQLMEEKTASSSIKNTHQVIRIYDGQNTLTDLRTGFSNDVHITAEEFKLLIYGGIISK